MIDLLNLHTHITASGHTYNSLYEMVHLASVRGLSLFECSGHVPVTPGSYHSSRFINLGVLPRTLYSARLMMGVGLNVMDYDGIVNLERSVLEPLGYAVAGLRQPYIHGGTVLQDTNAYLGMFKSPLIHIIGHSDGNRFPIDYDIFVTVAGEYHKLLEVNNSSLNPLSFRVGTRDNYVKMPELCRHYDANIIINSGAHCEADAGNHDFAYALLEEVDLPQELTVNTFLDRLCGFLPKAAAILTQQEDERCGYLYRLGTTQEETIQEGNVLGGSES